MASVGPQLPPHLANRKRAHDEEPENLSSCPQPSSSPKRQRILGPTLPPASLNDKPSDTSSSSDDDDFGPSLPAGANAHQAQTTTPSPVPEAKPIKTRRDDWMMLPPTQDDLSARFDPTKTRARKFNSGKGPAGSNAPGAMWTETPEQKRQRLEDEVMGVAKTEATPAVQAKDDRTRRDEKEKAQKIQEYNDRHRNKSLYETHKGSAKAEKEDDPSKRAFDYEKDMSAGIKIDHAKKREMLKKAADFGSKFSRGSFL